MTDLDEFVKNVDLINEYHQSNDCFKYIDKFCNHVTTRFIQMIHWNNIDIDDVSLSWNNKDGKTILMLKCNTVVYSNVEFCITKINDNERKYIENYFKKEIKRFIL